MSKQAAQKIPTRSLALPPEQKALLVIKKSSIHNRGVFARRDIPEGTKIIEYVGERITKAESDRRADRALDRSRRNERKGAVYIVNLTKRYDLDGDVPWNHAKYVNHSCEPNCEFLDYRGHIWIVAKRDIKKGEELSYNYGYDYSTLAEEPHFCRCGTPSCVGYILHRRHWWRLRKAAAQQRGKGRGAGGNGTLLS